jgi:hypothetical protein
MYERCIIFLNRVNTIVSKILSKEKGDWGLWKIEKLC